MATFKNVSGVRVDVPLYDLHLAPDETFEVPDEEASAFDAQPNFASSRAKSPDYVADPALTGPVATVDPAAAVPAAQPAAPTA